MHKAGFPLFYWQKKIQHFSRTFQNPHGKFSKTFFVENKRLKYNKKVSIYVSESSRKNFELRYTVLQAER